MLFCSYHGRHEEFLAAIARKALDNCDQDRDLSLSQFRLALLVRNVLTEKPSHRLFSILQRHLVWEEMSLTVRLDMLVAGHVYLNDRETLDAWIGRDNWRRL